MKIDLNIIKEHKYRNLLVLIGILIMLVLMLSLSYAYFTPNKGSNSASTPGNVTGGSTDRLVFREGDALTLSFGSHNLNENTGNITESTNPTATLYASNEEVGTIAYYNVGFYVGSNTFVYSTGVSKTPELILTITDPAGNLVTEVDGLTYVTQNGVTGFDITEISANNFIVSSDTRIESNSISGKLDSWTFELTLINLSTSQNINRDSEINFKVMMYEGDNPNFNLSSQILENNGGILFIESRDIPDFSTAPKTNEGIFASQDDYGTSYYFRGAVDNNWAYFAGFYWRIVRINGDGSVRMIYSGITPPTEEQKIIMTGNGTQIGTSEFNSVDDYLEYSGYKYTLNQYHGDEISVTLKLKVDEWYSDNIHSTGYDEYVSDNLFCSDRTSYTTTAGTTSATNIRTSEQYFGSYIRTISNDAPSLECPNLKDAFTVDDTINGNGELKYPIGLINSDEGVMAGIGSSNVSYLYTNQNYWTISPAYLSRYGVLNVYVPSSYGPGMNYLTNYHGIRPVLSLKYDVLAIGTGTWNDPYIIV